MKIRIKGTEKVYNNRKEVKDAFGQFRYKQFLKEKAFDYLDEDGNVVEEVPIKPKSNTQTKKTFVKVYSSTDDLIF